MRQSILDAIKAEQTSPDSPRFVKTPDGSPDFQWLDGDTVAWETDDVDKNGKTTKRRVSGRLFGFDTRETSKYRSDLLGGPGFSVGEAYGDEEADIVATYARDNGFNTILPVPKEDGGKNTDSNGRDIIDLVNADGDRLSAHINASGAFKSSGTGFTDRTDVQLGLFENLQGGDKTGLRAETQPLRNAEAYVRGVQGNFLKPTAFDEAEYVEGLDRKADGELLNRKQLYYQEGHVTNWHDDRDLYNVAKNDTWQNLKEGFRGVGEGYYGALNLFGDIYDKEWLKKKGADGIKYIDKLRSEAPEFQSAEFFDPETGEWSIEGVEHGFDQLGYLAAGSLPYLVGSVGAALAGAGLTAATGGGALAVAAGTGLSVLPGALVYSGQTYEGQEGEKDPVLALKSGVSQAVVERLAVPAGLGNIFTKVGLGKVVNAVAKGKGITKAAAAKLVSREASQQASVAIKSLGVAGSIGAAGLREAITEAGQERLAIWGENNDVSDIEKANRIYTALLGGFALGGAFGGGEKAIAASLPYAKKGIEQVVDLPSADLSEAIRADDSARYGAPRTNEQVAEDFKADIGAPAGKPSASNLRQTAQGADNFTDTAKSFPRKLVQGAVDYAFSNDVWKSPTIQRLGSILGVGNAQTGVNYQNAPQAFFGRWVGRTAFDKKNYDGPLGIGRNSTGKSLFADFANRDVLAQARKDLKAGKAPVAISPTTSSFLQEVEASNALIKSETGINVDLLSPVIDPSKVAKDPDGFKQELEEAGYSKTEAARAYDLVANKTGGVSSLTIKADDPEADLDGVLIQAAKSKLLKNFQIEDPVETVQVNGRAFSSRQARTRFLGENGEVPAKAISQAVNRGEITAKEGAKLARRIEEVIEANEGQRAKPGKVTSLLLNTTSVITQVLYLPLVTISSVIDLGPVIFKDVDPKAFKFMMKGIDTFAKGQSKETLVELQTVSDLFDKNVHGADKAVRLARAGFNDSGMSAARRLDAEITSKFTQGLSQAFFRGVGLEAWNSMMRGMRLSIGNSLVEYQSLVWLSTKGDPNKVAEFQRAEDVLADLGMDMQALELVSQIDTDKGVLRDADGGIDLDEKFIVEAQQNLVNSANAAAIEFTNRAVLNPTNLNRPLLFSSSNPWLRLFTQFQGFNSVMTAKFIPQLAKAFTKGNTGEKLGAATMLASMIGLAVFSLTLKASLKDAEDDDRKDDENLPPTFWNKIHTDSPFSTLPNSQQDFWGYARRLFDAAGLLGTPGSYIADTIAPQYQFGKEEVSDNVVGKAPSLNFVRDLFGIQGVTGDEKGLAQRVYDRATDKQSGKGAYLTPGEKRQLTPILSGLGKRGTSIYSEGPTNYVKQLFGDEQ